MATKLTTTPSRTPESQNFPPSPFRVFEDFFNNWVYHTTQAASEGETWLPPVDILEKDGNMLLRLEVPGIDEKDINLKLEGDVLTVQGERNNEDPSGFTYHMTERHHGAFRRSFTLPDSVDPNSIQANYKNGVLTITIPQKPEVKPRSISIRRSD